ncbi:unnamed protein product [Euphydryas editha]|uniref:Uncharacterized protein n=1 Tax=Euphydryas editha TaxID=104508 RepID=A0AAU9UGU2_EUPED|nr:unnamed protein product [Euphydryas editha]
MAKLVLLVICATGASARHLLDVNSYLVPSSDVQIRRNPETTLERRNIEYGSDYNLNQRGMNVEPLHAYNSHPNKHRTPENYFKTNNKNRGGLSEDIDNSNNMVVNNEYELKTNVYTSDSFYTTENVIEYNVYTNVNKETNTQIKSVDLIQENYPRDTTTVQEPNISLNYGIGQELGVLKTNKNTVSSLNQQQSIRNSDVSTQQNNFMSQEGAFVNNNMKTPNERRTERPRNNKPEGAVTRISQSNATKPNLTNRDKPNRNDGIPAQMDNTEEPIPWVWGSSTSDMDITTEKDDLNNRNAFNGDKCPSDKVKANGVCVDKH